MRERILLVEDDPSIRETTEMGLRAAGFDVVTADSGTAAIERFAEREPAAVVLDLMLPGIDGLEVCRRIRARHGTPILMLTARTDTADVVMGLEAGADDYLRKPFAIAELVARVRVALRRADRDDAERSDQAAERLVLGPLLIDARGYTVARGDTQIALSHTEFQLLLELVRHAGQVLTRDVLLDRIWGYDYLGDSRLVDVAIGRLRAKIERDPQHPDLIQTVRGVGYRTSMPRPAGA